MVVICLCPDKHSETEFKNNRQSCLKWLVFKIEQHIDVVLLFTAFSGLYNENWKKETGVNEVSKVYTNGGGWSTVIAKEFEAVKEKLSAIFHCNNRKGALKATLTYWSYKFPWG